MGACSSIGLRRAPSSGEANAIRTSNVATAKSMTVMTSHLKFPSAFAKLCHLDVAFARSWDFGDFGGFRGHLTMVLS